MVPYLYNNVNGYLELYRVLLSVVCWTQDIVCRCGFTQHTDMAGQGTGGGMWHKGISGVTPEMREQRKKTLICPIKHVDKYNIMC